MARSGPGITVLGLAAAFALAIVTRGGHLRAFWPAIAIIIAILFAAHLIRLIASGETSEYQPGADLLAAAFLGWAALSIPGSIDRAESVFEVMKLAAYIMVYFLAASLPEDRHRRALLLLFAAAILAEGIYGLAGQWTGKPLLSPWWLDRTAMPGRAHGTFLNPNHFASLMAMGAFIGMGITMAAGGDFDDPTERWAKRVILALVSGVMALAMVLSLSRGAWAGFTAGLVFFLFLLLPAFSRRGAAGGVLVLVIAALLGTYFLKVDQKPLQRGIARVEELSRREELTSIERVAVWKSAAAMIADHPVTGTGWGTFHSAYPSYRRGGVYAGYVFAHNDYLHIAAGMGVPGLILFLAFTAMVLRAGLRVVQARDDDFMAKAMPSIMAALFAVLAHELVDFNLMNPSHSILFFSLAGLVAARGREAV